MTNEMIVTMRITRGELCDLLLACTACYDDVNGKKWGKLHDKLHEALVDFDTEQARRDDIARAKLVRFYIDTRVYDFTNAVSAVDTMTDFEVRAKLDDITRNAF